jgi:flagellar biosynthesis protein FlhG
VRPPDDTIPPRVSETLPPGPLEDEAPPLSALPPDVFHGGRGRKVIAIGGGRGGVGKTLLTVNLGVFFAQLGRNVVVCDADPFSSNLHAVLGLDAPPLALAEAIDEGKALPVATTVPGLRILPIAFDPMTATPMRPSRRIHWSAQIQNLDADYVLLNLGSSTTPATLDMFQRADVGVCVTTPEPPAIETTYRFVRALFARQLRRALMKERFKLRLVERAVATAPPLASPREIVAAIKRFDDGVAKVAALEMARLMPRLVVGQTRLRSDLDLGNAMAVVSERYLGVALDYIGHIEQDDAVWLTVRRARPLLIDSPTSKSARNIERVARRILALLSAPAQRAVDAPGPDSPMTLYEVLGVTRGAADDEIRRAYKRQREIFRDGSLPVVSVVSQQELRDEQSRIEEAYDTLLDPVRRRAYDLSAFPDDPPISVVPARRSGDAALAELAMLQAELAREIDAETEFSGPLLRKVRESLGIEIAEIAQRTKISTPHLLAIEADAYVDLPAPVYVQGFVQQVAKLLKLDAAQVAKTYMRRLREVSGGARAKSPG